MTKTDSQNVNNTSLHLTSPKTVDADHDNVFIPPKVEVTLTDTIAAVTVAILSCIILITVVLIIRAIKKRRRVQLGNQINHIPSVSTGIMGTGVAAYSNTSNRRHNGLEDNITWESIDITTSYDSNTLHFPPRGDNSI